MKLIDKIGMAIAPVVSNRVLTPTSEVPLMDLRTGEKRYIGGREHADAYYSNAFRACLLAKARPICSLPVDVYERLDGVRRKADGAFSNALSDLLRHNWNPYLTASEGYRWAMFRKDTVGNAYIRVEYDAAGLPRALWPLAKDPDVLMGADGPVFRYGGDKFTGPGNYLAHEVVWVKSPVIDDDGLKGVSLAKLAARELGLSIDLEEFYARLLENGNHFPGWLETDQSLDKEKVSQLREQLDDKRGIVNAGTVRIFPYGLKYRQSQMTMADMSLVEQERWILQQTCRTLSVPPQEVFDLSNATYSNIEQGALNFSSKTLVPECKALETAFSSILWNAGLSDMYIQFDLNGLLRGDYKSRMEGYRVGILSGMFSPNDCLSFEDMAPYEGGEVKFRPAAYIPVDPETGAELEGARRAADSAQGTGGSGEEPDGGDQSRPKE